MYNFALVGCGRIATRHAENIKRVGRLVAVCDVVQERVQTFSNAHNAKAYANIDDLLEAEPDLDVISICSPNGFHAEHAIKALRNGNHVLCEKPMCLTSAAALQMIDAAYQAERKLFVVKQNRFNPPVALVKKLVAENKLGAIYSFQINGFWDRPQAYYTGDWKGTKNLDGGILYTQFSHFIDLLYWMLGEVKWVNALCKNYSQRIHSEIEDTIAVLLEMQCGAIGTLHFSVNSYQKNREGSFVLVGENGTVKIGGQYLNEIEWFDVKSEPVPELERGNAPNDYGFYTGSMSNHQQVYQKLVASLRHESKGIPEGLEALKTVEIIEKIYKACSRHPEL